MSQLPANNHGFVVVEDDDDPLQPEEPKANVQVEADESPLSRSIFQRIFSPDPQDALTVSQIKPAQKYNVPQQSEKAQTEFLPLLPKFKGSLYYSFLEKCSYITSTTCTFYEQLLNVKLAARIIVTNFCLLIDVDYDDSRVLYNPDYFVIPYPSIAELRFPTKDMLTSRKLGDTSSDFENIVVCTKDFRLIYLCANSNRNLFRELPNRLYIFNSHNNFFGLSFKQYWEHDRPQSFDLIAEFRRQGIKCEYESVIKETKNGAAFPFQIFENLSLRQKVCESYPKFIILPAALTREQVLEVASFRANERLPILTYYWREKKASLWRGAQCRTGLSKSRCPADEFLVSLLHNQFAFSSITEMYNGFSRQKLVDVHLYDARDRLAVFGNMLSGKGSENPANYKNCEISFNNLPNMNMIQSTFGKLVKSLTNLEQDNLAEVKEWLECSSLILQLTSKIVKSLVSGTSVFVHCSDGWDRTSQVCALAQIAIDPYYRTIDGFVDLVSKDFVHFGHMFSRRNGMASTDRGQWSPIFLQFLDCLVQIHRRSADKFEFNERFLIDLSLLLYSGVFGEFLANNYQEREERKLDIRFVSLYEFADKERDRYANPNYIPSDREVLFVPTRGFNMIFWKELFYHWTKKTLNTDIEMPVF